MKQEMPLITIAIPTCNRAAILKKALDSLLPQVKEFASKVEVLISDNGSTDNTGEAIEYYQSAYPDLTVVHNHNKSNLGFFGNARICRELSRGQYMWLLSDDDFVVGGIVARVVSTLNEGNIAFIHLKNNPNLTHLKETTLIRNECIKRMNFNLGLISSGIFLNDKQNDEELFKKYDQSPFIGLIMLLRSTERFATIRIIEGNCLVGPNAPHCLQSAPAFFDAFVRGMDDVIEYMRWIGLGEADIGYYRRVYLIRIICRHYIYSKISRMDAPASVRTAEFEEIDAMVRKFYSDLLSFWLLFYPLTLFPGSIMRGAVVVYRKCRTLYAT